MRIEEQLDNVYSERNELAVAFAKAALAAGWKAGKGADPNATPDWGNVVYVDLPSGYQVSWHIAPRDVALLNDLPVYEGEWDGTFLGRVPGWTKSMEVLA